MEAANDGGIGLECLLSEFGGTPGGGCAAGREQVLGAVWDATQRWGVPGGEASIGRFRLAGGALGRDLCDGVVARPDLAENAGRLFGELDGGSLPGP